MYYLLAYVRTMPAYRFTFVTFPKPLLLSSGYQMQSDEAMNCSLMMCKSYLTNDHCDSIGRKIVDYEMQVKGL